VPQFAIGWRQVVLGGDCSWRAAISHDSIAPCSASSMLVATVRPLARPAGIDEAVLAVAGAR
jgi:hypothetical protein